MYFSIKVNSKKYLLDNFKKIFDRFNDKLNALQLNSSSNLSSSTAGYISRFFEKTLYLLIVISYRKKNWIIKLLSHNLLSTIIKTILRVVYKIN